MWRKAQVSQWGVCGWRRIVAWTWTTRPLRNIHRATDRLCMRSANIERTWKVATLRSLRSIRQASAHFACVRNVAAGTDSTDAPTDRLCMSSANIARMCSQCGGRHRQHRCPDRSVVHAFCKYCKDLEGGDAAVPREHPPSKCPLRLWVWRQAADRPGPGRFPLLVW